MLHATFSFLLWWLVGAAVEAVPVSLAGSPASMERQHRVAVESGYDFLRRPGDVARAVENGLLVELEATAALGLKYPRASVARAEVKHFLDRFAAEMQAGCGESLVVTSLTRPLTRQPRNAHPLSVHPAGMAIDLRVPRSSKCRRWLDDGLLDLEAAGVLDATRERSPAHYHVALFPERYLAHMGLDGPRRVTVVAARQAPTGAAVETLPHSSRR